MLLVLLLAAASVVCVQGNAVEDRLFTILKPAPCVSLMNTTGVVGCAPAEERTGAIIGLSTASSVASFVHNPPAQPSVVLIPFELFSWSTLQSLSSTGNMVGVMVAHTTAPVDGFSPATPMTTTDCAGQSHAWNPTGNSLNMMTFDYPIVQLSESDTVTMQKYADENTRRNVYDGNAPQYVTTMSYVMTARTNSITCIQQRTCLPVGGYDVWSVVGPPLISQKPVIVVGVAVDSNAFFHDLATGAMSDSSSVAALLAAVQAVTMSKDVSTAERTLVVVFYTGEAYDYMGSRSFWNGVTSFNCSVDVEENVCVVPYFVSANIAQLHLPNVHAYIQIDQMGGVNDSVYVHTPCEDSPPTQSLTQTLLSLNVGSGSSIVGGKVDTGLPPTAAREVVWPMFDAQSQAVVVLSGYDDVYSNKYYHSQFDTGGNVNVSILCRQTVTIASALSAMLWPSSSSHVVDVNCTKVTDVFKALVGDLTGSLTSFVTRDSGPITAYASVYRPPNLDHLQMGFAATFVANATAVNLVNTTCSLHEECGKSTNVTSHWCIYGHCVESRTFVLDAHSPSVYLNGKTGTFVIVNETSVIWTESYWNTLNVSVFLRDNAMTEWLVFIFGVVVVVGSLAVVHWGGRYYNRHFKIN